MHVIDDYMNTLFFTSPYSRSIRTIRMEYGLLGKKYVLRTFDGEITSHGEREDLPKEEFFDKEQELLKQVHERKNVLVGVSWSIGKNLWIIQNKQSTSQPSFLKTDGIDSQVSLNYK